MQLFEVNIMSIAIFTGRVFQKVLPNLKSYTSVQSRYFSVACKMSSNVKSALEKHEVIPDVIDNAQSELIDVSYKSGKKVDLGNELTPTEVKDVPVVNYKADSSKFYTLIMTDPDAPSRKNPEFREWHHWLVANIPGNDVSKGETLSEYIGSGPPEGTGLHRYVFLVYKQAEKLTYDEKKLTNRSGDDRAKFSTRKFTSKYSLGDPVAANFYQAQYDDYVPILYKQLGE